METRKRSRDSLGLLSGAIARAVRPAGGTPAVAREDAAGNSITANAFEGMNTVRTAQLKA